MTMTTADTDTDTDTAVQAFVAPGPGSWMLDTTHHGRRPGTTFMTAISEQAGDAGFRTLMEKYGLPLETMEFRQVNGYTYARPRAVGEPANGKGGAPPTPIMWLIARLHPEMRRRNRAAKRAWADEIWRRDVDDWFDRGGRDAVVERNLQLQAVDVAHVDDAALADHLDDLARHLVEQFEMGFATHGGDIIPCGDFLAHCAEWGIGAGEATSLLAGASPMTTETRALLRPAVDAARASSSPPASIDAVRDISPVAAEAIDGWLQWHGWRLLASDDIDSPTLMERPDLQLRIVTSSPARDAIAPTPDPSAVRTRVPASDRDLFDRLLADARYGLRLRDDNVGIRLNWPAGLARRAVLEAGRRLVERGEMTAVTDGFCTTPAELAGLVRGRATPDRSELDGRVATRRRQLALDAPSQLGPDEDPPPFDALPAAMRRSARAVFATIEAMQGDDLDDRGETSELAGHGVSGEPFTGTARVIAGPDDDLDRIESGDVLVAAFTSPSFNSVFPLLGAVAVEEGGVMSHTAIVSREFGIPAVVGVRGLLAAIVDGDRVTVDPVAGVVRLAGPRA